MKKGICGCRPAVVFLIGALFVASHVYADIRIFTAPGGKTVEAEIVDYDARSGLVQLKRKDGKELKVKPCIFVEADQRYIKNWMKAQTVLADQSLRINSSKKVIKEWKVPESKDLSFTSGNKEEDIVFNTIDYQSVAYEFTFKNAASNPIKDVELEYCIYYEQSPATSGKSPEAQVKTRYEKTKIMIITTDEPYVITTEPVTIYEDLINALPLAGGDPRRGGEGKIIGVLARVSTKVGELTVSRSWSYPKSLDPEKYPWVETTSSNEHSPTNPFL
ncbi:MAG: hypothetical protein JXR25_15405 [Pontiellaceae bacterium]|nr:hypothetical protein [Pontiellaceae bacterium]MBN2786207.1 hypothetical protein [Pontiellaceae bacterium]